MKIQLSICEYSVTNVVCKLALEQEQMDKATSVIKQNPHFAFVQDEGEFPPCAEIELDGVSCCAFVDDVENGIGLSMEIPRAMLSEIYELDLLSDQKLAARVIADTWVMFVPYIKKLLD